MLKLAIRLFTPNVRYFYTNYCCNASLFSFWKVLYLEDQRKRIQKTLFSEKSLLQFLIPTSLNKVRIPLWKASANNHNYKDKLLCI